MNNEYVENNFIYIIPFIYNIQTLYCIQNKEYKTFGLYNINEYFEPENNQDRIVQYGIERIFNISEISDILKFIVTGNDGEGLNKILKISIYDLCLSSKGDDDSFRHTKQYLYITYNETNSNLEISSSLKYLPIILFDKLCSQITIQIKVSSQIDTNYNYSDYRAIDSVEVKEIKDYEGNSIINEFSNENLTSLEYKLLLLFDILSCNHTSEDILLSFKFRQIISNIPIINSYNLAIESNVYLTNYKNNVKTKEIPENRVVTIGVSSDHNYDLRFEFSNEYNNNQTSFRLSFGEESSTTEYNFYDQTVTNQSANGYFFNFNVTITFGDDNKIKSIDKVEFITDINSILTTPIDSEFDNTCSLVKDFLTNILIQLVHVIN